MNFGVLAAVAGAFGSGERSPRRELGLKPEVVQKFYKACEPIRTKRRSPMGSTSRGKNWFPRRSTRLVDNPNFDRFYQIDHHGSIRRRK